MNSQKIAYMQLALKEAAKGLGRTSPNPCVGAILVRDNTIIGRGYHEKAGTPHAEVNAIRDAGDKAKGATLYVTLEPCNHTGSTPPCTQAILSAGIIKVIIGTGDPNPSVAGGGAAYLHAMNVEVESGLLENECRALIRPFAKHVKTGFPWVTMKAGMSLDGKISFQEGYGGTITGSLSQHMVHTMRDSHDAVLIGVQTALIDDPSLTTRLPGNSGRDPLRVILDTNLRLSPDSKMLKQQSSAPTWIFCGSNADVNKISSLEKSGAVIHKIDTGSDGRLVLQKVLKFLGQNKILSVLVEGGSVIHGSLLQKKLVDEAYLFVAPFFIGSGGTPLLQIYNTGKKDEVVSLQQPEIMKVGEDFLLKGLICYHNRNSAE